MKITMRLLYGAVITPEYVKIIRADDFAPDDIVAVNLTKRLVKMKKMISDRRLSQ